MQLKFWLLVCNTQALYLSFRNIRDYLVAKLRQFLCKEFLVAEFLEADNIRIRLDDFCDDTRSPVVPVEDSRVSVGVLVWFCQEFGKDVVTDEVEGLAFLLFRHEAELGDNDEFFIISMGNGHGLDSIGELYTVSIQIVLLEADWFLDIISLPSESIENVLFKIDVIYRVFVKRLPVSCDNDLPF